MSDKNNKKSKRLQLQIEIGSIRIDYGLGDLGSIPGCVIPKTLKIVLDTSLLNTQQYKVRIKGNIEQSREMSCAFSYTLV